MIFYRQGARRRLSQRLQPAKGATRTPLLSEDYDRSSGFALLIVMWMLVLLAFIVAHITASGRTEIRIAANLSANAAAAAAAEGGIFTAIFNLADGLNQSWTIDGTAREVAIGRSRVIIRLHDESARINPNWASPPLLEALLRVIGSDAVSARQLAATMSEWVGTTPAALASRDARLEYPTPALKGPPPGVPIEALDELDRVPGMTPEILRALRPHLTLFGPPEPSPTTDDPIVAAALAQLKLTGQASVAGNQAPPDVRSVRIEAIGMGPGNARVNRTAIVRFGPALPDGYDLLAWGNDLD